MRLLTTALIAALPFAANAGGHGTFYICKADGMAEFEIEIAARDCQVGRSKAKKSGDTCDFGGKAPGKVTMASDQSMTVEMDGKTFKGQCNKK